LKQKETSILEEVEEELVVEVVVVEEVEVSRHTTTQGCIKKLYKDPRFFSFQCTHCLIQ
jgi:hypothetical protein